jgi:hypothetical protein
MLNLNQPETYDIKSFAEELEDIPYMPTWSAYDYSDLTDTRAKARNRSGMLQRLYGMTMGDYDRMLRSQEGKCKICGTEPAKSKPLAVDHCHKTGKVRGLLCNHCNCMLGFARDSTKSLKNAIKYLKK